MHAVKRIAIATLLAAAVASVVQAQDPERVLFQSNAGNPPAYGYDYEEGVSVMASTDCVTPSFDCPSTSWTRYRMDVTANNFDYLGKDLDNLPRGAGKESYAAAFRIRAEQNDGRDSGFAAVFSTEDTLHKGDGKVTGSFRNSVKAKFQESGNAWSVKLTEVVNGAERDLATGSTHGSDEHRLFHFYVDNRADTGPRIELQDYAGAPILTTATNPAFAGALLHSQWFVAYGFGDNERTTILVADAPSTRIYDTHPQPPVVEGVEFTPNPPDPGEDLLVTATITDDWRVEAATVFYRVNGGGAQQVSMTHDTGSRWTAIIPGQQADAHVVVRIEATDDQGLVGHSEGEYSFTVGAGDPIDRTDNTEIPDPPGSGGVDEPEPRLGAADYFIAVLGIIIGGILAYIAVRDGRQQRAVSIAGATVLIVGAYLVFRANPGGVRDMWFTLLAALAVPPAILAARAWIRRQRRGGQEGAR